MFDFFKKKKAKMNKSLKLITTSNESDLIFQFAISQNNSMQPLTIPLNNTDFRECSKLQGFEQYWAYELFVDEGYIHQQNKMKLEDFYYLLSDDTFDEAFKAIGFQSASANLRGELKINGSPAHMPSFDLQLYDETGNLSQTSELQLPFFLREDQKYFVPKEIFDLWQMIIRDDYEDGYEKTAIVRQLAIKANVNLDNFLSREEYNLIEEYKVKPLLINQNTLQLSIEGKDNEETAHLNTASNRSSVKSGFSRKRYVTPKKVIEDVKKIKQKSIFKGEEIPMLVQNSEAFFPDLNQPFELEKFSDRVIGLVKIVRPTMVMTNGGYKWFDYENGASIEIDEQSLRQDILNHPENKFIQHKNQWVFIDTKLKEMLGIAPKEQQQQKEKYGLEIMSNVEEVTYNLSKNKQTLIAQYELPHKLKANLFPHQKEGYNWLFSLYNQGLSGLLADDMGLGKTLQVITFMQKLYEKGRLFPSIIVLPIALIENWEAEIAKFAPELHSYIYVHKGAKRISDIDQLKEQKLIFTSYDTLKIDQLLLGQIGFECIILDEAQNIKSNTASRSRAIRAMQGKFRLAMTGTPVENSLEELWTIMDFVEPGALDSLTSFKNKYIKNADYDLLKAQLQKYYLRRTKDEVMRDKLPKKHLLDPTYVAASKEQVELAAAMMANVRAKTSNLLNVIGQLRMLYAHPNALTDMTLSEVPPKFDMVIKLLQQIKMKNEKVLIFTEFKKVQCLLKRYISENFQISVPIINGETDNRSEVVRKFNESKGFGVLILSPKAAGVGLTITGANHVIHYTRWWNPAVENQATDRVYRIGQNKEVFVYQIITQDQTNFPDGTVEEIMHQILSDKTYLAQNVIVPFDTSSIQKKLKETIENQKFNC